MKRLAVYAVHFTLFTAVVPYVMYLVVLSLENFLRLGKALHISGPLYLISGSLLVVLGLAFMLRAEFDMYMHGGDCTPFPFYNPPKRLVREGIYACTRNPMYLGTTLEYCGIGVALGELLMVPAALITLLLAMSLYFLHEKPKLERQAGGDFRSYVEATPLLIPRGKCLKHAFPIRRLVKLRR